MLLILRLHGNEGTNADCAIVELVACNAEYVEALAKGLLALHAEHPNVCTLECWDSITYYSYEVVEIADALMPGAAAAFEVPGYFALPDADDTFYDRAEPYIQNLYCERMSFDVLAGPSPTVECRWLAYPKHCGDEVLTSAISLTNLLKFYSQAQISAGGEVN